MSLSRVPVPLQLHDATASEALALGMILHAATVRLVASRARTGLILALVDLLYRQLKNGRANEHIVINVKY